MYPHNWKCIATLILASLMPLTSPLAEAQPESDDVRAELDALKTEFEQMKAAYEARIQALEQKIAQQETLRAAIQEKQKEIQSLNEKVAKLDKREGAEALDERVQRLEKAEAPRHGAAPVGAYGGLMNPDVSLVVDVQGLVTDNDTNPADETVMVKHSELALQGYLYPGIRADFIGAIGQHAEDCGEIHTHVEVEEAYASFLDLPGGLQVQLGRKLLDFGRLNPIHPHHWSIADTPLPLQRLFGDHPFYDDGFQVSGLIPNPWDLYIKAGAGIWYGRQPGEEEPDEALDAEEEMGFHGPVHWDGRVYSARASLDLPFSRETNLLVGYSFARDEGGESTLHGVDLTLIHRWPMTYKKLRWQNEFFFGDFQLGAEHCPEGEPGNHPVEKYDTNAWGMYSLLQLTLNKYWEAGTRFDWWDADYLHSEWSAAAFLSYYFTHSMYLRPEFRYSELADGEKENAFLLQFVWGLGPHAHRLED